ncbi:hypothetical protein [Geopseudomonas guangdongensis]|uniref:hypothetical protein n=1 Tax=Geopseudomonas guangdongensis TaxID=1245526 RepID=UPI00373FD4DB
MQPVTGKRIETKGANHPLLKAWKTEFGADVVEGGAASLNGNAGTSSGHAPPGSDGRQAFKNKPTITADSVAKS